MDTCTFQPTTRSVPREVTPPPQPRPTKASILREEAAWLRQERLREGAMMSPCNSLLSITSAQSAPGSPGTASTGSLRSRSVLEAFRKADAQAAYQAERRRTDIQLQFRAGAETRSLSQLRRKLLASESKLERHSNLEARRQEDAEEMAQKQEVVQRSVDRRGSISVAAELVCEERRLKAASARHDAQCRQQDAQVEEQALLEQRRALVVQMQDMEGKRTRLLQERRDWEIQKKRQELMQLRDELAERHTAEKDESDREVEAKRSKQTLDRSRKYEDLLGRAQQLEYLRTLDRQLSEQLRADDESRQIVKERSIQEAREQAMQDRETRFVASRQQLVDEEMQQRGILRSSSLQKDAVLGIGDEHSGSEGQSSLRLNSATQRPSSGSRSATPRSSARVGVPQGSPGTPGTPRPKSKSASQVNQRLLSSRSRVLKLATPSPHPRNRSSNRSLQQQCTSPASVASGSPGRTPPGMRTPMTPQTAGPPSLSPAATRLSQAFGAAAMPSPRSGGSPSSLAATATAAAIGMVPAMRTAAANAAALAAPSSSSPDQHTATSPKVAVASISSLAPKPTSPHTPIVRAWVPVPQDDPHQATPVTANPPAMAARCIYDPGWNTANISP